MRKPRRRRYGRTASTRRQALNFIPYLLLAVAVAVVGWFGWRLWQVITGATSVQALNAVAVVERGVADAQLAGDTSGNWARVFDGNYFRAGDTLKTKSNAAITLEVGGNTFVHLNEETELKIVALHEDSEGQPTIELELQTGDIWTSVSEDLLNNGEPQFRVQMANAEVQGAGGIVAVERQAGTDTVRVLQGDFQVRVPLDEEAKRFKTIDVGVSQKATLSAADLPAIRDGRNVLEGVETAFEESEWNLSHLVEFDPQKVEEIRRTIEVKSPVVPVTEETDTPDADKASVLEKPVITAPKPNEEVAANEEDRVGIEGTTSPDTQQIKVKTDLSDQYYTLTLYNPGDTTWRYVAAKEFGTLKQGQNTVRVIALDKDGKQTEASLITFNYLGAKEGVISPDAAPAVGGTTVLDTPSLSPPTISSPPSNPFRTANNKVTITGGVDIGTNSVEVNGFRLQEFKAGDRSFTYTANANYGNMKEGPNDFIVTAYGPGNESASSKVVIIYTPLTDTPVVPETPSDTSTDVTTDTKTDNPSPFDQLNNAYKGDPDAAPATDA